MKLPYVEIGGTVTIQEDTHVFTFTRRAHREWKCDVVGCVRSHVMGLKTVSDPETGESSTVPNTQ